MATETDAATTLPANGSQGKNGGLPPAQWNTLLIGLLLIAGLLVCGLIGIGLFSVYLRTLTGLDQATQHLIPMPQEAGSSVGALRENLMYALSTILGGLMAALVNSIKGKAANAA